MVKNSTGLSLSLLLLLGGASLAGCEDKPAKPVLSDPVKSAKPAVPPAPPASTSAAKKVEPPKAPATPPPELPEVAPLNKNFQQVSKWAQKRCQPKKRPTNNVEIKGAMEKANGCLRKLMVAELDKGLLPLKKARPAAFRKLMKEQAVWNRMEKAACRLEEERYWTNFKKGTISDGTHRSIPLMGCQERLLLERIFYAQALAHRDAKAMAKRIKGFGSDAKEGRGILRNIHKHASTWVIKKAPKSDLGTTADWKGIVGRVEELQKAPASMAANSCGSFPGLGKALGDKCRKEADAYYTIQTVTVGGLE